MFEEILWEFGVVCLNVPRISLLVFCMVSERFKGRDNILEVSINQEVLSHD